MSTTPANPETVTATLAEAPLAAPAAPTPKSLAFQVRMWSLFIVAVTAAILGLGVRMTPSPDGVGTHSKNLWLPPCGFLQVTTIPCPTCGCTTAVTHLAHGNLWQSIKTQPFGAAFGVAAVILLVLGLIGLATGKWIGPQPFWISYYWRRWIYGSLVIFAGGWIYKIIAMKAGWH